MIKIMGVVASYAPTDAAWLIQNFMNISASSKSGCK